MLDGAKCKVDAEGVEWCFKMQDCGEIGCEEKGWNKETEVLRDGRGYMAENGCKHGVRGGYAMSEISDVGYREGLRCHAKSCLDRLERRS